MTTASCKSAGGSRCQHHCISAQQTSRCSCAIGFTLNDDQQSCDTGQLTELRRSKLLVIIIARTGRILS